MLIKSYNCPLCETPVAIPEGQSESICPNCGNIVITESPRFQRYHRLMPSRRLLVLIIGLAIAIGIFLWLYCGSDVQEVQQDTGISGIDSIQTENYANPVLEYYYYIPLGVAENKPGPYPLLVMLPGLNSNGEYFVSRDFKDFAESEGFVIIAPSFAYDKENFKSQQSYQYPSVWSGDALLEIIDQFEENNDIVTSALYFFGFSAGAQFSLRFCLWKPWSCAACAAHGSGGYVIPDTYVDVKFFVTVGQHDTDRWDQANTFYNYAKDLGINVTYRKYNVGHGLTHAQIEDSIEFFISIGE